MFDAKGYYTAEEALGYRNQAKAADTHRFGALLKRLGRDAQTLTDVGCGEGYWLDYLARRRPSLKTTGVELAPNRVERAREQFPHLDISEGSALDLPVSENHADVVTCLEVLEHIPDWRAAVAELLRIAKRRVIITVPYRENLRHEICIHCHQPTPQNGHLHRFEETAFDYLGGDHAVSVTPLVSPKVSFPRRLLMRYPPRPKWFIVRIDLNR